MRKTRLRVLLTRQLALLLSLTLASASLSAQSSGLNTLISTYELAEGGDSAVLNVFFNVIDGGGLVAASARVNEAALQLNNETTTGRVTQAQGTSSIVLVLDASGSMTSANADMRRAAISAAEKARDKAQFAVFSFSDQVQLLQDFSPQAADAINRVLPVLNGGTCLYDAAYAAVEKAAGAPAGRRAVILFTDGVDEKANGMPCSARTFNEVLSLTRARRVPIYTVGLRGSSASGLGQINEGELASLARGSGGLSAVGGQDDLGSLFNRIIEALTSQWQAQFLLYPTAGTHTVRLLPKVDGVTINPAEFQLSVAQDYLKPFQLQIDGFAYDQSSDTYTLTLSSIGTGRAVGLQVILVDKEKNTDVFRFERSGIPEVVSFTGRDASLRPQTVYTLRLRAIGRDDQVIGEVLNYDFKHAPPQGEVGIPPQVRLLEVIPNPATGELTVEISVISPQQVGTLRVTITEDGGATIPGMIKEIDGAQARTVLTFDISSLTPGRQYGVVVRAFGRDGALQAEAQPLKFTNGEAQRPPQIGITAVIHTRGERSVRLQISSADAARVDRLRFDLFDAETGTLIMPDPIYVQGVPAEYALSDDLLKLMEVGKYRVRLTPLDINNQPIGVEALAEFVYVPPTPGLAESLAGIITNPLVLAVLLAALVLLGVYVWRSRQPQTLSVLLEPAEEKRDSRKRSGSQRTNRPRKPNTAELGSPDSKTQVDMTMAGGGRAPSKLGSTVNRTTINKRAPEETLSPQFTAYLKVLGPTHDPRYDEEEKITIQKFVVGREGKGHMNFNYASISRQHFSIEYQPDTKTFVLTDTSSNGTVVDDQRISKGQQVVLAINRPVTIIIGEDHERVTLQFSASRAARRGAHRSSDPLDG
ncbi:MAG: FHA domain-containing protein [Anaerolineae bacterium]|nr:FHA domain-containing protein [Anaerolineae bacterium]MDW8173666.1 FHA domain-containing protein [Anaerolineae bacterium]